MASLNVSLTGITGGTLSNDNLTFVGGASTSTLYHATTTEYKITGKWYWEVTVDNLNAIAEIGIISSDTDVSTGLGFCYRTDSNGSHIRNFSSSLSVYGSKLTTGDIVGIALDIDNKKIEFFKNGVSLGSPPVDFAKNAPYSPYASVYNSTKLTFNFGEKDFNYSIPSGYKSYGYSIENKNLIKTNDALYMYLGQSDEWETLQNEPTAQDFLDFGMDEITAEIQQDFESKYGKQYRVYNWTDGEPLAKATLKAVPPPQLIVPTKDIIIKSIDSFKQIKLISNLSGDGILKVIVSFDQGRTWYTWTTDGFVEIDPTAQSVLTGGITPAILETIPTLAWDELRYVHDTMRFAYLLSMESIADRAKADTLQNVVDMKGTWKAAIHGLHYDYEYPDNQTALVTLYVDGDFKINV